MTGSRRRAAAASLLVAASLAPGGPAQAEPERAAAIVTPAWAQQARERCMLCHSETSMQSGTEAIPVPHVDDHELLASEHGGLACVECHVLATDTLPHGPEVRAVACGDCHEHEAGEHAESVHRDALFEESPDAPRCQSCHGGHAIADGTNPASKVYPLNVAQTCVACHEDQALVNKHGISIANPLEQFASGVHGRGMIDSGLLVSATCNDCHGSHLILPREDARSQINAANVSETCGTCHVALQARYEQSVHGTARMEDDSDDVPVCVDCHGMHEIQDTSGPEFHAREHDICARCHGDAERMTRYGLSTNVLNSYLDDFHGRSNRLYAAGAGLPSRPIASCPDCHGVHDIQPFDGTGDAAAVRARVVTLCRRCHETVPDAFADAWLSHYEPAVGKATLVWAVKLGYSVLIPMIMAALLLHIFLNLVMLRGHLARGAEGLLRRLLRLPAPHPEAPRATEADGSVT